MTPLVIKSATAKHYGVHIEDLIRSRKFAAAQARKMAMYVMRQVLTMSYPAIAREFNHRDHTSAMLGVRETTKRVGKKDGAQVDFEAVCETARQAVANTCAHCHRPFENDVVRELRADFDALRERFFKATERVA